MATDAMALIRPVYEALLESVDAQPGWPSATARQLAEATGLDVDTVSQCLDMLESRSVVILTPWPSREGVWAVPVSRPSQAPAR